MKAKCHNIERLLSDYIDGTLSERQTADVALHLRSCWACKREVVALKKTNHLLENFYVEPEAPDVYYAQFTTQLQQRIEQSAPTTFHQRWFAIATRLRWHLLIWAHRYVDLCRPSRFIAIRRHAFPYYVLVLTMATLVVAPLLLHDSGEHMLGRLYATAKAQFFSTPSSPSVQPAATLAIKQDNAAVQPMAGIRRYVSSGRTTETPAVDSSSDVWEFTDEPIAEGYILITRREKDVDAVPSVVLDIDSELLAYAELPTQGTPWARLTSRDVLTADRYTLLLLQGIRAEQHAHQQYERKPSESKGFSQKLLDVPLEILSITEVYDSIEL